MTKFRIVLACLLSGAFLVACSAEPWQDKDCDYWTTLSNDMAQLAYEADQMGDVESFNYYKESWDNIQKELPEICS